MIIYMIKLKDQLLELIRGFSKWLCIKYTMFKNMEIQYCEIVDALQILLYFKQKFNQNFNRIVYKLWQ